MHTAVEAQAWSDKEFTEFLLQGSWSGEADDNIAGEKLSADLIKRVVANYRANPSDHRAQSELGLLPLTMGVAEWGVADSVGLPRDPAGKDWASDTGKNSGKHLMSYAVGGIGIFHADAGDLQGFIRHVAQSSVVPSEHREDLLRLATGVRYQKSGVVYDELRAAGVCAAIAG